MANNEKTAKRKGKGKIAAIIAAVCVVAAAAVAIGYGITTSNQAAAPTAQTQETTNASTTEGGTSSTEGSADAAKTETEPQAEATEENLEETLEVVDNPIVYPSPEYVLFIGDDDWENYTPGRADLMLLARLDFEKHLITMITVPRDTKYTYADGTVVKLNQVYYDAGAEAQCQAVSEVVGVNVSQYAVVGFDGLQNIVEYFGGLDINLPYALDYSFYTKDYPNEVFEAGEQTLTPWRAMALSRTRTSYTNYGLDNDSMRQLVDRRMMVSLMKLAFANPSNTGTLLTALQGFISTNIPLESQISWCEWLTTDTNSITVYGTTGPFEGGLDESVNLWLVTPNPDGWALVMAAVNAGEDPSAAASTYCQALASSVAPVSETSTITW